MKMVDINGDPVSVKQNKEELPILKDLIESASCHKILRERRDKTDSYAIYMDIGM
jgi:hypothetical protein